MVPFVQVKLKVGRSLKVMRGAGIRTRKLTRDMLVFWKRVDKEMVYCFYLLPTCSISIDFCIGMLA